MRTAVKAELRMLQTKGIIEPTQHIHWGTPQTVEQNKKNSNSGCTETRSMVNKPAKPAIYLMPTVTDRLAIVQGGTTFQHRTSPKHSKSCIDGKRIYMLPINTFKGLYKIKRMPLGIWAALVIFQRYIKTVLAWPTGRGGSPGRGHHQWNNEESAAETPRRNFELVGQLWTTFKKIQVPFQCKKSSVFFFFVYNKIMAPVIHAPKDALKAIKEMPETTCRATLNHF